MSRAEADDNDGDRPEIRLVENPDGKWTARHLQVEISAEGETPGIALENLMDVVDAVTGDGGHEPTDAELRDLGVDPDKARSQDGDLPDVLQ
ncbi:HicB family protein [Haloarcula mannanilytica]|uniref:HicB family protein n=1 Tax=Haloarcula mannanilytica TaxID=2509225 RepID=A0A4C2ER86_9EURY|nr:type II toxin-antitoxin system HicB family antitoxin [Haloarcula mannanilytica]GCF16010.1 HicB family protein [Haloarcula mannanilytica]